MNDGAKDRFKRAELAAKKGNFEYAIELYLQGLTLDPKAAEERQRLHSIEALAIEQQGGNPQGGMGAKMKTMGTLTKVKKLSIQKKWDEAVYELEKAIRFQPRNAGLLLQLSELLRKIEAEDGAVKVLEEVTAVDKQNTEALRRLGQLWGEKDPEKAISYWERLRMVRPQDKEAAKAIRDLSAANMVRRTEERKSKSGDESFQALLKDEEESADLEKKAKVIRTDEDRREAIKFKLQDIKQEPRNSRLWRELGTLYQDLKEYKHALAAFKKALEVNPHDLFANDKIGNLREQQANEKLETARARLQEAETNGGNGEKLEQVREEFEKTEKEVLQFKLKEYNRRVKAHPTDYELKMRYGELLMEAGELDLAIQQFQKAVKDPKFKVRSQNLMGVCFQRKGIHALAIGQFNDALKGVADQGSDVAKEIRYNLAVTSQESGDSATALKNFEQIMGIDIGYRDVSARVEELLKAQKVG